MCCSLLQCDDHFSVCATTIQKFSILQCMILSKNANDGFLQKYIFFTYISHVICMIHSYGIFPWKCVFVKKKIEIIHLCMCGQPLNWDNWRHKAGNSVLYNNITNGTANSLIIDSRDSESFDHSHIWGAILVFSFFLFFPFPALHLERCKRSAFVLFPYEWITNPSNTATFWARFCLLYVWEMPKKRFPSTSV